MFQIDLPGLGAHSTRQACYGDRMAWVRVRASDVAEEALAIERNNNPNNNCHRLCRNQTMPKSNRKSIHHGRNTACFPG